MIRTGKVVISGVRRLPRWLLSRVHYEASRRPFHCASREMLCRGEFLREQRPGEPSRRVHDQFSGEPVDRWLRLENMAEDFISHFEGLLGPRVRTAARKLRKAVNATRLDYVKSLDFYFTRRSWTRSTRPTPPGRSWKSGSTATSCGFDAGRCAGDAARASLRP
jgi:hypothetical protein